MLKIELNWLLYKVLIFNLARNLYKSLEVMLQKTPNHFDVGEFKSSVTSIEGVNAIDDFHVWSLDGIDSVLTLKVSIIYVYLFWFANFRVVNF